MINVGDFRTFKKLDVPSSLTKSAPDYCSVYVIAKGKVLSVRSAQRPVANTAIPPKLPHHALLHHLSADYSSPDDGGRALGWQGGLQSTGSEKFNVDRASDNMRSGPGRQRPHPGSRNGSLDYGDVSSRPRGSSARSSCSDDDLDDYSSCRSADLSTQNLDFSVPDGSKTPNSVSGTLH
ncbi:hypothetical protein Ancab_001986 [Ancistrocladus abbreviatus]